MRPLALGIVTLIASASAALPVAADEAASKNPAMSHGWDFAEQGGADLYSHVCAACHQADGRGAVGAGRYPPLAADEKLASGDYVVSVLVGGLKDMPPIGAMMSDAQVADVANYVRTHFGNTYSDAVSAEAVSAARRRSASAP